MGGPARERTDDARVKIPLRTQRTTRHRGDPMKSPQKSRTPKGVCGRINRASNKRDLTGTFALRAIVASLGSFDAASVSAGVARGFGIGATFCDLVFSRKQGTCCNQRGDSESE
jgi:hypothetical protein